jgi:hypothetical protein
VVGGGQVVAEVKDRRDAGIDGFEHPSQVAEIHVPRCVLEAPSEGSELRVSPETAVVCDGAHLRLPRVSMRVHEAGADQAPVHVNDLGIARKIGSDFHDVTVLDQDVSDARWIVRHRRDNRSPTQQLSLKRHLFLSTDQHFRTLRTGS